MRLPLGRYGVWLPARSTEGGLAAAIERLGFKTLWLGGIPDERWPTVSAALEATESLVVSTGIVNMWRAGAPDAGASYHRIAGEHPDRIQLGVGIGHPERTGEYHSPYDTMDAYLTALADRGVPADRTVLAALGPRVLRLAASRTAGAHPYLTTPEHTRRAREVLGSGPLLAPEHKVIVETDPDRARAVARKTLAAYLELTNYTRMLRGLGFTGTDLADGGSDRLVDALVLHGDATTVADGIRAHRAAGADHVAVQPLGDPLVSLEALAPLLVGDDS
jgi:probable F420-dependent oxidoreductase